MEMKETHEPCRDRAQESLYRIGMFAAMNHVTIKALRYYDEQGLLAPAYVDLENGYRYYTLGQTADLQQILALKESGFSLDDIREIRSGVDTTDILAKKRAEILSKLAALTEQLAKLESYMNRGKERLASPVRIKKLPEVLVASMERRIESYDDLFTVMPEMGREMERLGCECAIPEYCFTHYLEPGYKEEDIRIETCEAVTERKEGSEKLRFQVFPETEAACIFHRGSYQELPMAYEMILQYIEENGYEIVGNIRENYIDGVWNKDSESEWLTEIQIPIKNKVE